MTWSLFRWIWEVEGPVHIGIAPAGSLNRCRLYVPARALWGALTAELARREVGSGDPDYPAVGERLRKDARFTYLYPAEYDGREWRAWLPRYEEDKGLVWKREDRRDDDDGLSDRKMRARLVSTRAATAIDPNSDTAAEGSLRETECINTHWRNEDGTPAGPVALKGYVLTRAEGEPNLAKLETISVGGDSRYGLGRLRRIDGMEADSRIFRLDVTCEQEQPVVAADTLLAHGQVNSQPKDNANKGNGNAPAAIIGDQEAIGGWDYDRNVIQRIAGPLWSPGSRAQSPARWIITAEGTWSLS